jgi:hypothetical protein
MSNVRIEGASNPMVPAESDKFLFFVTPSFLAQDACCGCSLKTGTQIISLIFLVASLSNFFTALRYGSIWSILITGIMLLLYFTACLMIFYSSMNYNYTAAYTAYLIYAVIFMLSLVDTVVMFLMMIFREYKPFGPHYVRGILGYLVASIVILSIQLYMVWIVYSYAVHLKYKAHQIVSGEYIYKYNQPERVGAHTAHI